MLRIRRLSEVVLPTRKPGFAVPHGPLCPGAPRSMRCSDPSPEIGLGPARLVAPPRHQTSVVMAMPETHKTMERPAVPRLPAFARIEDWTRSQARRRKHAGLTIVELMVAIVLVAIVLSLGIANYDHFSTSNTVVAELHSLRGAITLARSEAATTGANILVCSSNDPTSTAPSCSGVNEWNTGWVVLSPANGSCLATSGQPLAAQGPLLSQNTIVFVPSAGSGTPTSFCFNRNGFPTSPSTAGMFVFNTKTADAGDRLCLSINLAGHMQTLGSGQGVCP